MKIGDTVLVPPPGINDPWEHAFVGRITEKEFNSTIGVFCGEGGEGTVYFINPTRLTLINS
jgi:hypothetical protein